MQTFIKKCYSTGIGGNMIASSMCLAPAYCASRSGQCCLVVRDPDTSRIVCQEKKMNDFFRKSCLPKEQGVCVCPAP